MKKNKKLSYIISFGEVVLCLMSAVFVSLSFSHSTYAASDLQRSVTQKTALHGLYDCYLGGSIKQTITTYNGTLTDGASGGSTISLPFNGSRNLSCYSLLSGSAGGYNGLYKQSGIANIPPSSSSMPNAIDSFLTNMGYSKGNGGNTAGQCVSYNFLSSNKTLRPDQQIKICNSNVDGNSIKNGKFEITNPLSQFIQIKNPNEWSIQVCAGYFKCADTHRFTSGSSWQDLTNSITSDLRTIGRDKFTDSWVDDLLVANSVTYQFNNTQREPYSTAAYSLGTSLESREAAASTAIRYLSNKAYNGLSQLKLSNDEKVYLLQWYLNNTYKIDIYGCDLDTDKKVLISGDKDYSSTYLFTGGSWKECYIKPTSNKNHDVGVYNSNAYMDGRTTATYNQVLEMLKKLKGSDIEDPDAVSGLISGEGSSSSPGSSDAADGSDEANTCYKTIGGLAWILCPVTELVGWASVSLYNSIIEPFLVINADTFSQNDSNGGVYSGWSTFRNVANIVFAIVFVVVILAQITGIGINNYNIKKILPRLIVVVVLVNISFIICQLAIDISNIVGSSLNLFFQDLAGKVQNVPTVPVTGFGERGYITQTIMQEVNGQTVQVEGVPGYNFAAMVGDTLAAMGMVGAGAAVIVSVASIHLWILPFIVSLLGCLLGIFFFFVLLGVRQAGVILLTVLAPVAIVCYALPNTKTFFDRWRKMFTSLLLVYPICGLLIGGGQYASALLISSGNGNFFFVLAAMLLSVVPFFMIPSILRSSMAMMGNLGMRISNFGRGVSGWGMRTARGSEWYKSVQRQHQLDYDTRHANDLKKRIDALEAGKSEEEIKELRNRHKGLYRKRARYLSSASRALSEDLRAMALTGTGEIGPGTASYDSAMSAATREAMETETNQAQARYESGIVPVDENNPAGDKISTNDHKQVGEEYAKQLLELEKDPNNRATLANVRALQNILMASDPGRGEIKKRQLAHATAQKKIYGDESVDKSKSALAQASAHLLSSQHQGNLKKSNRGLWAMQTHFNSGDFSHITALDENGDVISSPTGQTDKIKQFTADFYEGKGLDGYGESELTGADDDALRGINRTIKRFNARQFREGPDSSDPDENESKLGKQVRAIATLAGNAYGKDGFSTQGKVAEQMREMIINGSDAPGDQPTILGGINAKALNKLADDITTQQLSDEQKQILVKNAYRAFRQDGGVNDAEHAAALNHILAAAGQQTVEWSGRVDTRNASGSGSQRIPHDRQSTPRIDIAGSGGPSDREMERLRRERDQRQRGRNDGQGGIR